VAVAAAIVANIQNQQTAQVDQMLAALMHLGFTHLDSLDRLIKQTH
jgi:hypothetical protein